MEMIPDCIILFIFLASCFASEAAPKKIPGITDFDHFWLVETWPFGFCSINTCHRNRTTFVLHGLWPVNSQGQTLKDPKATIPDLTNEIQKDKSLQKDLDKYWPSLTSKTEKSAKTFWAYEWKEHGSSQPVYKKELDYLRRTIQLMKMTDLLGALKKGGVVPDGSSYPRDRYKDAIMAANSNRTPILRCGVKNQKLILMEVVICVDGQAKNLTSCNKDELVNDSCKNKKIWFLNKEE